MKHAPTTVELATVARFQSIYTVRLSGVGFNLLLVLAAVLHQSRHLEPEHTQRHTYPTSCKSDIDVSRCSSHVYPLLQHACSRAAVSYSGLMCTMRHRTPPPSPWRPWRMPEQHTPEPPPRSRGRYVAHVLMNNARCRDDFDRAEAIRHRP